MKDEISAAAAFICLRLELFRQLLEEKDLVIDFCMYPGPPSASASLVVISRHVLTSACDSDRLG